MGIMVYSLLWVVQDFVHQPDVVGFWSLRLRVGGLALGGEGGAAGL